MEIIKKFEIFKISHVILTYKLFFGKSLKKGFYFFTGKKIKKEMNSWISFKVRPHRPTIKLWDHHQCSEHAQCVYLSYYYYFRILIFLSHRLLLRFRSHWWELVPTPPVGASYGASYLRQLSPVSPPVTGHNWWRNWWQLAEKLVTTGGDSWRRNWRQLAELAPVEITL